jgi:BirA family biotin operon repressor/biotin-[acetyl-CoA-carboxylase] ligase
VPFLAALAVRDAVLAAAHATGGAATGAVDESAGTSKIGARMVLKWPNDILIGGAKLAGILVETTQAAPTGYATATAGELAIVIGIGLNIVAAPAGLDQPATSLADEMRRAQQHAPGASARMEPSDANAGSLPSPLDMLERIDQALAAWRLRWAEGRGAADIRDAWCANSNMSGRRLGVIHEGRRLSGVFAGLDPTGAMRLRLDDGGELVLTHGDIAM